MAVSTQIGELMYTKDKFQKFERRLEKFFHSNLYILFMAALTLLGWKLNTQYALAVMILTTSVMFLTCRDITPFLALHWFYFISFRDGQYGLDFAGWKIILPILLVLSLIVNIVRFKPDFKGALSPKSIKRTTLSMFLLIIPMSLGGIMLADRHVFVVVEVVVLFVCLALAFAYYMAIGRKNIVDKTAPLRYVIKMMLAVGILCSLQIIISVLEAGSADAMQAMLTNKRIYLGWGGANHVGALLGLCIPASFYYMIKSKKFGFVFVILTFVEFCILVVTQSRGAIMFTAAALPFLFAYVIATSPNKRSIAITAATLIATAVTLMVIFRGTLTEVVNKLLDKGFDDSGRFRLYKEAVELFKNNPIFGGGWDYKAKRDELSFTPLAFHSMLLQVLACSGIIGLIFYTYYYWARYSTFFKVKTPESRIVLAGMLILEGYGMIDPISFFPITYFIVLMTMSLAAEQALPDNLGHPLPFIKRRDMRLRGKKSTQ